MVLVCILCFVVIIFLFIFFFFKQKTAYEMRISDWSSDVCSSDLGTFEILLSAERPTGHTGNWLEIKLGACTLMVRKRSYDWAGEIDPVLSIENLDAVPPKPRLSIDEILQRIKHMAGMPAKATELFYGMQNQIRDEAGINEIGRAHV